MQVEFSKGDFWRAFWAGELIALLALPVLKNLSLLEALGGAFARKCSGVVGRRGGNDLQRP